MSFFRTLRSLVIVVLMAGLPFASMGQSRGRTTRTAGPPSQSNGLNGAMITLSGNVITDDGSPLPGPVSIERICKGRFSRDGSSDFKGYFTFSVNVTAASALAGCELQASLAGFRSSSLPLGELGRVVGAANVGTIVLQRMDKAQGATVSVSNLNAPEDAKKAYDKGHRAVEQNKLPEAQQDLEKAVQLHPRYAAAWQDLGWLYAQQNQLDKARHAFEQARNADGMFVPAYLGLSSVALRESQWTEAAELSARATQLDGVGFPAAFYYNSLANYRLGNLEQAEKSARKAEMLGVQRAFPQVSLLLGVMLANRQDYADAADQLRSYLKAAPTAPNADKVRQQLAEMERREAAGSKAVPAPPAK